MFGAVRCGNNAAVQVDFKRDEPVLKVYTRLLEAWEYDVLPLSKLFSMRTVRSYWPRWRELLFYAQAVLMMLGGKSPRDIERDFLS